MNKLKEFWYRWQQSKYLPDDVLINEKNQISLSITLILLMTLLTFTLILWAVFAKIEETTLSYGTVVPKEKIVIHQEVSSGKVDKLFVDNGDIVKAGQSLLTLNRETAKNQLAKTRLQAFILELDILRWQSFANHSNDLTTAIKNRFAKRDMSWISPDQFNNLAHNAQQQLNLQLEASAQEKNYLQNQIAQQQQETEQMNKRYQLLENNSQLLNQQMDMYKKLINSHAVAKNDMIDLQRKINDVGGDIAKLLTERAEGQQSLLTNQQQLATLTIKQQQNAFQQVTSMNSNLAALNSSINDLIHMINTLTIQAPVAGIIQNVNIQPGDYLEPGKNLLTIIPLQRELVVVARVASNKINRVSIGDPVRLRVLTKAENYVSLTGKVVSLSTRSYTDRDNDAFYLATISIDSNIIQKHGAILLPGTNVEAYISVGKESLLKYLLSSA